jgi:hypothetical protein
VMSRSELRIPSDADHRSEVMAITIPTGSRSLFGSSRNGNPASSESFYYAVFMKRAGQAGGRPTSTGRWRIQFAASACIEYSPARIRNRRRRDGLRRL